MDDALISLSDERNNAVVDDDIAKSARRRSGKRRNAPTLESQNEIFKEDTLMQIQIFREARSRWLEERETRKGDADYDSEFLFGEDQSQRKRQTWLKRMGLDKFAVFYYLCRNIGSKKHPPQKEFTKKRPPKEKSVEEGLQGQEVKPAKSIMKIVTQKDIEDRELAERERERERNGEGEGGEKLESAEGVTIIDENESIKRRRRESSDEMVEDTRRRKFFGGKKNEGKQKKPLKFERIPGPEEQCKCDHSGEYTVLVKGVCFCDRPKRPTCIPIIPPEYFKPHKTERLEPDVKIDRRDSLLYHKRSLRRSRESLEEKKIEDEKEKEEKQEELIEIKSSSPPTTSQEVLTSKEEEPPETKPEKSKDLDDIRIEKLMSHHKTHFREDHHHPIHFQELPEDKSDVTLKTLTDVSLLSETPSDTETKRHFLLKRKGSRIPTIVSRRRELFEKPSTIIKSERDKKNKTEHGHVHFDQDALSYQDSDHEDLDTNKYYTKYGRSGETFKKKQDKTTMTVLIDFLYDWWKRKPK